MFGLWKCSWGPLGPFCPYPLFRSITCAHFGAHRLNSWLMCSVQGLFSVSFALILTSGPRTWSYAYLPTDMFLGSYSRFRAICSLCTYMLLSVVTSLGLFKKTIFVLVFLVLPFNDLTRMRLIRLSRIKNAGKVTQ